MNKPNLITTYIITPDDQAETGSVSATFAGHEEFSLNIISRIPHDNKIISLKNTVKEIVRLAVKNDEDYILICNNEHQFSDKYSTEILFEAIKNAKELNADILCGGINLFWSAVRISENLFWVEDFTGLRFVLLFKSYYKSILENESKVLPYTNAKFFIYPFLSIQKKATNESSPIDPGSKLSDDCSAQVKILDSVSTFYKRLDYRMFHLNENSYNDVSIPTYIINLAERTDRLAHIKDQFHGRNEFDIQIVEAFKHRIGAVGLWESMRQIIKKAIVAGHEYILICEDDHEFTAHYSKSLLVRNIMEAQHQKAEMLAGGICEFHMAVPITDERVWVDTSFCTQFIIIFKSVFEKIINQSFDDSVTADSMLSYLLNNKMVFYPFISTQKHFGYSDVTQQNNEDKELLTQSFARENARLKRLYAAKAAYERL